MRTVTLLFVVLAGMTVAGAQTPRPQPGAPRDNPQQKTGTARLSGRVLAADTGRPLRRAIVQVPLPGASAPRWVWTDQAGRWQIAQLPAGRYTLTASKSGYLTLRYGQLRPFEPGKTLDVADGQVLDNLSISLPKGSVIAGRILDEFGDPVSGAHVHALRYRYADGQRRLMPMAEGFEALLTGMTDDIGQYRLHGLPPGDYYVAVWTGPPTIPEGQSDDRTGYAPSFFPGTAAFGEAQRVTIGVGQEAQNVSFAVSPIRFATVSGTILNSSGQPVNALNNFRLSAAGPSAGSTSGGGGGREDGTFVVQNVAPGDYNLSVSIGSMGRNEVASIPVTVAGQDITGLTLVTAPGGTATGRVIFEGNPEAPPRTVVGAFPVNQGGTAPDANFTQPKSDGTFEIDRLWDRQLFRSSGGLAGGRVDWTENTSGWFLKSVTLEGKDITDAGYEFKPGEKVSGIEIVLTERATMLSGTVQDDRARPIGDYTVIAFSADSSKWGYLTRFVRAARPDQVGKFLIKGLPPDEYLLVAVEYVEPGEETDPDRLEKWKTIGTRVSLAEAETKPVTLKLTR